MIIGKTYSLNLKSSSDDYYIKASILLEKLISTFNKELCKDYFLQHPKLDNKIKNNNNPITNFIREEAYNYFHEHTIQVEEHLKSLCFSFFKYKTIKTSEIEYHYYMLAIEFFNQLQLEAFNKINTKVLILPHCFNNNYNICKAKTLKFGNKCTCCRKECFINIAILKLKSFQIEIYIANNSNFKKLFSEIQNEYSSVGIIGVACIPELYNGMKLSMSIDIPTIGIPLDANRCTRWCGKTSETSFNVEHLISLLNKEY